MMVLSPTQAIVAAIVVVVLVILAWKFVKFAFRIAILVAAAVVVYFIAKSAGWL